MDLADLEPSAASALRTLLERVVATLAPPVDLDRITDELNEGVALIATLHPEVYAAAVVDSVYGEIAQAIAEIDPQAATR